MTAQERWIDFPPEPTFVPPRESSFPEFREWKAMTDRNRRLLLGQLLRDLKPTKDEIALLHYLCRHFSPHGAQTLYGLLKKFEARGKGTRAPARGQR